MVNVNDLFIKDFEFFKLTMYINVYGGMVKLLRNSFMNFTLVNINS